MNSPLREAIAKVNKMWWPIKKDIRYRIQSGYDAKMNVVFSGYFGDEFVCQSLFYSSCVTQLVCWQQRRDAALAEEQIFYQRNKK